MFGRLMNRVLVSFVVSFGLMACQPEVVDQETSAVETADTFDITFQLNDDELMQQFATVLSNNEIPHRVNDDGTISYSRKDRGRVQVVLDEAYFEHLRSRGIEPGDVTP